MAPSKQESTTYEPSLVCKLLILGCRLLIPDRLLGVTPPVAVHGFGLVLRDTPAHGAHEPEAELRGADPLIRRSADRVEIVMRREYRDGRAEQQHDHGGGCTDQFRHLVHRLYQS